MTTYRRKANGHEQFGDWAEARGCDVAPKCVQCPLERCKYDERGDRARNYGRIVALLEAGVGVSQIARATGLSLRTVQRHAQRQAQERA